MHDIPILMLHTVNDNPKTNPMGELSVSSKGLNAYLKVFKKWRYQMISMDDFINKNYDENKNFIILTFDDGYKDNLTVALSILKKYNAKATIFVNPEYVSLESDPNSDWGFMTWEEINKAEESGVFDIQAHTMTHEFIFTSDKVVDYYTPKKFNKYYWLAWMLFPESPKKWDSSANKYKTLIPTGYPIFEYGRRLSSKKFIPDNNYIKFLTDQYNQGVSDSKYDGEHGYYETDEEFEKYVKWEVEDCKNILENRLNKKIHTLCFPGGAYTDYVLEVAKDCGYVCYMNASRLRIGNNYEHLEKLKDNEFVGLNRTSFTLIHPGFLPDSFFDYWNAKLCLGTYQKKGFYRFMKKVLSKILHS